MKNYSILFTVAVVFPLEHTLLSAFVALYGPTKKWGNENTSEPKPISAIPMPIHRGFDAPGRPPKYVTGTRQTNDAMS